MIEDMPQIHMTEAEVTKDFPAVLEKVRQGTEIMIEEGYRTVAVFSPVKGPPADRSMNASHWRRSAAPVRRSMKTLPRTWKRSSPSGNPSTPRHGGLARTRRVGRVQFGANSGADLREHLAESVRANIISLGQAV